MRDRLDEALAGARLPLAVGLLMALLGLLAWNPTPVGAWHDDGVYSLLGRALASGEGLHYLGVPGSPPAARFPPVYPTVLAGLWTVTSDVDVFSRLAAGLNLLLTVVAAVMFALWARDRLGLRPLVALAGTVIGWLHLEIWWTAFVPMSEPLFLVLMVATLGMAARLEGRGQAGGESRSPGWRSVVGLAVLLLLLIHTRSAGVAVLAGVTLGLWVARRRRRALTVAGLVVVGSLPWWLWTRLAEARIPGPLRDMLVGYSGWLSDRFLSDPVGFALGVPAAGFQLGLAVARWLLPWVEGPALAALGPLALALCAWGAVRLHRRSPAAAWTIPAYLGLVALWPFSSGRLLVPVVPLLGLATVLGAVGLTEHVRRRLLIAVEGVMIVWGMLFLAGSAERILGREATAPQEIRSRQLAGAILAVEEFTEPGEVVGAPELWPAIPLYTGRQSAPSAPFRPQRGGGAAEGTPQEQWAVWDAAGLDYVVTEAAGRIHGEALDSLLARCPVRLPVAARWDGQSLVRLDWDEACRASLGLGG